MFALSRRWTGVVVVATAAKLVLILMSPPKERWGDFYDWVNLAQKVVVGVNAGHFPSLATMGAYLGLSWLIAPLFWFWTVLPVQHPSLTEIAANPSVSYSLLLVMKLPILVFDLATGLMLVKLVQQNNAPGLGRRAFLSWYLNPYNWIWLYWYSTYDIIPTALVVLAVLLALRGRWLTSGFCLSFAFLLRLYPILLFPFFLFFAGKLNRRTVLRVAGSFVTPILFALVGISMAAGSSSVMTATLIGTPLRQGWLLLFYGVPITDSSIILTPFLLLAQLYLILLWTNKSFSLMHGTLASLLLIFAGSYHHGYHFLWASPFLSANYDLDHDTLPMYVLLYVCAFLSPITYEGGVIPVLDPYYYPMLIVVEALSAGAAIACKLFYVLQLNIKAIGFNALSRYLANARTKMPKYGC